MTERFIMAEVWRRRRLRRIKILVFSLFYVATRGEPVKPFESATFHLFILNTRKKTKHKAVGLVLSLVWCAWIKHSGPASCLNKVLATV